jgi:L-rhamnose isomerase/sugar isomerase
VSSHKQIEKQYQVMKELYAERDSDLDSVKEAVKRFEVEVPSWVFGAFGGGRFGAYMPPGPARNIREKLDDAAMVHKLTGATPRVAIHGGWDKPDEVRFEDIDPDHFSAVAEYAQEAGIGIGAVNPTLFLEGTHYGSLSSPLDDVRKMLVDHCIVCCEIAERYATKLVTYWLPDGSNYPGQVNLWAQEERVRDSLRKIYDASGSDVLHLVEYKLFEPGTYSTLIVDAGTAKDLASFMGDRAGVLVDMGHHAHGVNIAQIVARLIGMGVPGGFHFNTRYAADDDHSVEPNIQMYAIFCELVAGGVVAAQDAARNWAYMIDQCSGLENRMQAILHSVDSLQVSLAKALLLDQQALKAEQDAQRIIPANRVFLDAFLADVRPVVAMARIEQGLQPDPVVAYDQSGYQEKIEKERGA